MRVIEHTNKNNKKAKKGGQLLGLIVGLVLVAGSGWFFYTRNNQQVDNQEDTLAEGAESVLAPNYIEGEFKTFSPNEFQELYESIAYPNTELFAEPPEITGNKQADERIRTIAESRGYSLRSVPVASILQADDPRLTVGDDDLLQAQALLAWRELETSANNEGIPLKLNSGYRSIQSQRTLFNNRLRASGATTNQIANGQADNAVVGVLTRAALPGYSRHHTGYTIDLVCGNGVQSFEVTTCFKWLKANNYLNAKKQGWIPSYPEGVDDQGPEPESWEYVWVSKEALYKEAL